MASAVSAIPLVRRALVSLQRRLGLEKGGVMEGRDIGTVVFPDAEVKIFLTASAEARADRRHKQLKAKGINVNLAHLLEDIRSRDERDSQRQASPLKPADDAIQLDTTDLSIDEVVDKVLDIL